MNPDVVGLHLRLLRIRVDPDGHWNLPLCGRIVRERQPMETVGLEPTTAIAAMVREALSRHRSSLSRDAAPHRRAAAPSSPVPEGTRRAHQVTQAHSSKPNPARAANAHTAV